MCAPLPARSRKSMADYYPPIAQAVNGLEENTAAARRSIYDRARAAMAAQLHGLTPSLSESEVSRELTALERVINRVETESHFQRRTPIRETGYEQAEMSRFPRSRSRSSMPPDAFEHTPVATRAVMKEKRGAATRSSPRRWQKPAALAIMGLFLIAVAASVGLNGPEIFASLRSLSNSNETIDATPRVSGGVPSKNLDRIGSTPFAPPNLQVNGLVAQKAMLYEESKVDRAGKSFAGTAVWRAESVAPGAGQLPKIALRGDFEIPEQHINVHWTLRGNDDAAMAASHTMEITFSLPPNFPHGGISRIAAVLMKQAEATPGTPLAGVGVKVSSNVFLISLSSAEADVQRNVQLLKERSWFDIPLLYEDGQRAIIVVEKGGSGDRAFSDAFEAWEQ
jgi:hypothetical protein